MPNEKHCLKNQRFRKKVAILRLLFSLSDINHRIRQKLFVIASFPFLWNDAFFFLLWVRFSHLFFRFLFPILLSQKKHFLHSLNESEVQLLKGLISDFPLNYTFYEPNMRISIFKWRKTGKRTYFVFMSFFILKKEGKNKIKKKGKVNQIVWKSVYNKRKIKLF